MDRIAREIFWSPLNIQAASIGRPNGLTRNERVSRIKPLGTEQVSNTATARIPITALERENRNAEQDSNPTQIQVNRSRASTTGNIIILNTVFIATTSFTLSYKTRTYVARICPYFKFDKVRIIFSTTNHSPSWFCLISSRSVE